MRRVSKDVEVRSNLFDIKIKFPTILHAFQALAKSRNTHNLGFTSTLKTS